MLDELNNEIATWDEAKAHGGYHTGEVTESQAFSFRPVSVDDIERTQARVVELRDALVEHGFEVDETVLPLVDVLSDPSTSVESAVGVAVGLLRELALSSLGKGILAATTTLLLERLCASRAAGDVVQLFVAELGPAFRLLPLAEAIVKDRLAGFIAAKRISQR